MPRARDDAGALSDPEVVPDLDGSPAEDARERLDVDGRPHPDPGAPLEPAIVVDPNPVAELDHFRIQDQRVPEHLAMLTDPGEALQELLRLVRFVHRRGGG